MTTPKKKRTKRKQAIELQIPLPLYLKLVGVADLADVHVDVGLASVEDDTKMNPYQLFGAALAMVAFQAPFLLLHPEPVNYVMLSLVLVPLGIYIDQKRRRT